jgi:small-conductance mechanosensitive channel
VLARLMGFNYIAELSCELLFSIGFRIRADFPTLISRVSYALFLTQFIDLFTKKFTTQYLPQVKDNKRQQYVLTKATSFLIWLVGGLVACEMIATYMRVPLSSILAFGGIGGLALGLSAKDIAGNFLGGLMLLFNEPFTPGDLVSAFISSLLYCFNQHVDVTLY